MKSTALTKARLLKGAIITLTFSMALWLTLGRGALFFITTPVGSPIWIKVGVSLMPFIIYTFITAGIGYALTRRKLGVIASVAAGWIVEGFCVSLLYIIGLWGLVLLVIGGVIFYEVYDLLKKANGKPKRIITCSGVLIISFVITLYMPLVGYYIQRLG